MAFGIPNIERIVSNFLEGSTGITSQRSVDFDKNFLWVVDFVGGGDSLKPPAPFDAFFPASDVTFKLASLNSNEFVQGQSKFSFPQSSNVKDISITFYDDEQRTLQKWMSDWINLDILNNGKYMSGLLDNHVTVANDSFGESRQVKPVRHIRLLLLNAFRKDVLIRNYKIYPDGDIDFSGSQASQATQYTMAFKVVEDLNVKESKSLGGFTFDDVKQFIGRFL